MGDVRSTVRHRWSAHDVLEVGDERFRLARTPVDSALTLHKPRSFVEAYLELVDELQGGRLVELGVFRGGSTALLAELYRPASLVALELAPDPPEGLVAYRQRSPLGDRVHAHFGVDQADRTTVARLVDEAGAPLDLVVDDASHLLGPTMTSFEVLFPRLRTGGLYVIEDWSSQLALADALAASWARDPARVGGKVATPAPAADAEPTGPSPAGGPAGAPHGADPSPAPARTPPERLRRERPENPRNLVPLVAHLVSASLVAPEVIPAVRVIKGMAFVRRGPAKPDPAHFDLLTLVDSGLRWPATPSDG